MANAKDALEEVKRRHEQDGKQVAETAERFMEKWGDGSKDEIRQTLNEIRGPLNESFGKILAAMHVAGVDTKPEIIMGTLDGMQRVDAALESTQGQLNR